MNSQQERNSNSAREKEPSKPQRQIINTNENCKRDLKKKPSEAVEQRESAQSSVPSLLKSLSSKSRRRHKTKKNNGNKNQVQNIIDESRKPIDGTKNLATLNDGKTTTSLTNYKIPKKRGNESISAKSLLEQGVECDVRNIPKKTPSKDLNASSPPKDRSAKTINSFVTEVGKLQNDAKLVKKIKRNSEEALHTPDVPTTASTNKNSNEHLHQDKTSVGAAKAREHKCRGNAKTTATVVKPISKYKAASDRHPKNITNTAIKEVEESCLTTKFPVDSSKRTEQHVTLSSRCNPPTTDDKNESIVDVDNTKGEKGYHLADESMEFEYSVAQIKEMVAGDESGYSLPLPSRGDDMADAMDVDILPALRIVQKQLVIIVDTNVWIANQDSIRDLLHLEYQPGSRKLVIIPWMVLQEIDFNVHKNKNCSNIKGFRSASKFIYGLLSAKTANVKGQKPTDALVGKEFTELNADDSILNCAIQYSKLPQCLAVLLTNDVNLLNKALISGITSFKSDKELLDNVRQLFTETETQDCSSETSFYGDNTQFSNSSISALAQDTSICDKEATTQCGIDMDDPMECNYSASLETARTTLTIVPSFEDVVLSMKNTLTSIIVPKMAEDYGEDWKFAIKVKPPFTFESALKCIQLHWIAVFSYIFPAKCKTVLEELLQVFYNKPRQQGDVKAWRITVCRMSLTLLSMNDKLRKEKERVFDSCKLLHNFIEGNT